RTAIGGCTGHAGIHSASARSWTPGSIPCSPRAGAIHPRSRLLFSSGLLYPVLGLLQPDVPSMYAQFSRQRRGILPRQLIQARNLERLQRQSIANPHSLALTQRDDPPDSLIKLRIYFRRPLFQSEELISFRGISLTQGMDTGFT